MQVKDKVEYKGDVLRLGEISSQSLEQLLQSYELELISSPCDSYIPGSFWGESEAGLIANRVYARMDTPVHSIMHETGHAICMPPLRRAGLDTDAGGDYAEENAVCYLQILLADAIPDMGRDRMMRDMDAWGYSFRLGSAQIWFEQDADDARSWLLEHGIINAACRPTGKLRAT